MGLLLALIAALALPACGDDSYLGTPVPNAPPQTRVTGTPPALEQTSFSVRFFWTGSDPDGRVHHYQWRISNNGRDGKVDYPDTLALAWHRTNATDSTFVVLADIDSLDADVSDPRQNPSTYRAWQTHTFFIRAVDDAGLADPTPATVSFTATTLTPTVDIDIPLRRTSSSCESAARVFTFGWTGHDPDAIDDKPVAVRYLLMEVPACYTRVQFERERPLESVPDERWSAWIPYGAAQDSGRTVTLPRQELQRAFFFAVQAKDVAGAVTPTLEWGVNVRHVLVADGTHPLLRVTERFLGTFEFSSPGSVRAFDIVSGQPLEFSWTADASTYAGIIEAYRYGFEVVDYTDPNDPGWALPWGATAIHRRAGPRSFALGSPTSWSRCGTIPGTISRGIFQFDVIQIARRDLQRDLLLVEDWPRGNTSTERQLDADWDQRWNQLLLGRVTGFDPAVDVLDTHDEPIDVHVPPAEPIQVGHLLRQGWQRQHAVPRPAGSDLATTVPRYNWFEVYQAQVGNVLVCGPRSMFSAIEYDPPAWLLPIPFNNPEAGNRGFGTTTGVDGGTFNRGTLRYPYTGWCLEAIDSIRPPFGLVFGEQAGNAVVRNRECDSIARAAVDADFLGRYPSAGGEVVDLRPSAERTTRFDQLKGYYQFEHEEFYNANTTGRGISLNLRSCQTTMYRLRARRDEGLISKPDSTCVPLGRSRSILDGVPIAIVSSTYSDTKPLTGSEDFLWGFHPLAFELGDVRRALLWIIRSRWQIPTE